MRYTKAQRQQIVEEFATRNNGVFNPSLFLAEVKERGPDHPAYDWFEWDTEKAALAYQIAQARDFARDIRIKFTIEEVGRKEPLRIRETVMPLVLSPVDGRRSGGGYFLTRPDDPSHMAEHCRQAATALRSWMERYEAALIHVGKSPAALDGVAKALEAASAVEKIEAA